MGWIKMQASKLLFEHKLPDQPSINYSQTRTIKVNPGLLRERRVVITLRDDPRANIFRMLRTKVLREMRENNWNSIAVTSASSGCGKTFVTVNLAIALAMEVNQTVLIVDTDLSRPKVDWYFGFTPRLGLLDYLKEDLPLTDILVNPGYQRLVILPGRGTTDQSSELLSSPKMINLVSDLKAKYNSRIILFDMPPLLISDNTLLFMPNFDAALFVVEDGKNTPEELHRSMQLLKGTRLLGTVLNKAGNVPDTRY
jgi:protein-tyrosine kinase